MATFAKVGDFVEQLGLEVHNLASDALRVILVASTHTPGAEAVYADVSADEVADGNGYTTTGQALASVSWAEAGGVATLDAADFSWTATGGPITYRYIYIYNETSASDNLVCYWDEGTDVTIADGETRTFTVDAAGILTLS